MHDGPGVGAGHELLRRCQIEVCVDLGGESFQIKDPSGCHKELGSRKRDRKLLPGSMIDVRGCRNEVLRRLQMTRRGSEIKL